MMMYWYNHHYTNWKAVSTWYNVGSRTAIVMPWIGSSISATQYNAELQELYLSRVIASYHDHRHYLMCIVTIVRLNLYLTWSSKIIKRFIYVVQSLELVIRYCIFIVFRTNLFSYSKFNQSLLILLIEMTLFNPVQ